ncbi:MAG: hypothetical protein AAFZ02_03545 [Pseudomonadota bacterium]
MDASFITFAGIVAAVTFVASRIYEIVVALLRDRRARQSYVRSLFAEIDFNTTDLAIFNEAGVDLDDLEAAMEVRAAEGEVLIPHITDARHTVIYSENLAMISALPDELVRSVVQFYGELEKIRNIIEGLSRPSYATIRIPGRVNTIARLYERTQAAQTTGETLLSQMAALSPRLELKRKERSPEGRAL